jgi:hypothetical protein
LTREDLLGKLREILRQLGKPYQATADTQTIAKAPPTAPAAKPASLA